VRDTACATSGEAILADGDKTAAAAPALLVRMTLFMSVILNPAPNDDIGSCGGTLEVDDVGVDDEITDPTANPNPSLAESTTLPASSETV
jgi:hypothetical protein